MTMSKRMLPVLLVGAALAVATLPVIAQAPAGQPPAKAAAQPLPPKPAQPAVAQKGPRPEQFKYDPLSFTPPKPADHRTTLSNGMVVYIAEDHQIPWFQAALISELASAGGGGFGGRGAEAGYDPQQRPGPGGGGGSVNAFLEPKDKLGVAALTASIIRSGGTATMNGDQVNERMDFLAGTLSATSLSIHTRHVDEGLKIWMDLLQNPAFPDDKLRREKDSIFLGLRNRNRNISTVATRTFNKLVYGDDSPITAEATEATTSGISREDLAAWHKKYWGANNFILVVAGDFRKAEMLQKLEATFGTWRSADRAVPQYPKVQPPTRSGVYMVQPHGITPNQGIIRVGHVGIVQDDPDFAAVDLMNYTLGGGSFSSRITQIVRNDNGLAYSTSSSFSAEPHYPGTFSAFCQTKNSTVVFATQLMVNEIERMRAGDITEKDLKFAKTARLNAFPSMFSTAFGNIRNFAQLELDHRPMDYYDTYVSRYEKVTLADIKRVARLYLQPDKMIIMVAGNIDECKAGADKLLPNQATIDAMAAKYGGRTIDGLAAKYGDGTVKVVTLK
jgi:predicted Zn-dependent peptidase